MRKPLFNLWRGEPFYHILTKKKYPHAKEQYIPTYIVNNIHIFSKHQISQLPLMAESQPYSTS
ncbi:hypothetical protein Ethha_0811 [Ethanoligenens harbinense YUAN-3]|uniref:Uncharacterized protein n=1 Tax=Ethanoligenens harbinense (strain DSM 18485 / JCM 12961 / CGMCC 1.5033 / YUAN-3) TaxID=663278 RepID=E6U313_ETHHY|nr:hypothetical protein Ethha_0811 [Ethanoligenens harbinense YUAN-3]